MKTYKIRFFSREFKKLLVRKSSGAERDNFFCVSNTFQWPCSAQNCRLKIIVLILVRAQILYGAKKTSLGRFRKLCMSEDINFIYKNKRNTLDWRESRQRPENSWQNVRRQLFLLQCFALKHYSKTQIDAWLKYAINFLNQYSIAPS